MGRIDFEKLKVQPCGGIEEEAKLATITPDSLYLYCFVAFRGGPIVVSKWLGK